MLHILSLHSSDDYSKTKKEKGRENCYCVRKSFRCKISRKILLKIINVFVLHYWPPLLLLKSPKSWHHCVPSKCVWQKETERSGPCYLTLTLCMASHNPTGMFASSYGLSWWNIWSVVNGFIVVFNNWGHIALKCIDLFFEWHDSSSVCVYCIRSL